MNLGLFLISALVQLFARSSAISKGLPKGELVLVYDYLPNPYDPSRQVPAYVPDIDGRVITVCFWVRETHRLMVSDVIELKIGDNVCKIVLRFGAVSIKPSKDMAQKPTKLKFDLLRWTEFCLTYRAGDSVTLMSDSSSHTLDISTSNFTKGKKLQNITVGIGSQTGQAFVGSIAMLRLFDRELTTQEKQDLNTCRESSHGTVNFTAEKKPSGNGFETVLKQNLVKRSSICGILTPVDYQISALRHGSYEETKSFCEIFGARLPSMNKDFVEDITDRFFFSQKDEEANQNFIYVENDAMNNGCNSLLVDQTVHDSYSYDNVTIPCSEQVKYAVCIIPASYELKSFRGDIENPVLMPRPSRQIVVFYNTHFAVLRYKKCLDDMFMCWEYWDEAMELYYYVSTDWKDFLVGRRDWKHDKHRKNTTDGVPPDATVTMSVCDSSSFTCNTGHCVPLEKRCNFEADCEDSSDESTTCDRHKPLPSSYWKAYCPVNHPVIDMEVKNLGVQEILMNHNEVRVSLDVTLSWHDPRVTFINLIQEGKQTLSIEFLEKLWAPAVYLPNGIYEDNLRTNKRKEILEDLSATREKQIQIGLFDSSEVIFSDGDEVSINYNTIYVHTFACAFDFFAFPFDEQLCYLNFSLQEVVGTPCYPVWNANITIISKTEEISMYEIGEFRYSLPSEHDLSILVRIKRRYVSYLFTTFIPCIVLLVLGYLTMISFRLDNFQDRITVTLSLLIVVASIFSQVVSTIPTSPSSKCVEIFFFYVILRLALVFILHAAVDHILSRESDETMSSDHYLMKFLQWMVQAWNGCFKSTKNTPGGTEETYPATTAFNSIGIALGFVCDVVFGIVLTISVMTHSNGKITIFNEGDLGEY